jgi:hypothetical protein
MISGTSVKLSGKTLEELLAGLEQLVIAPPASLSNANDKDAQQTVVAEEKLYDDELHQQTVLDRKSARADRATARSQQITYAGRTFILVGSWVFLIFSLLLLQGFGEAIHYKPLSDKVLITLITSTTANVIGMLIIVLKYIFNVPKA